MAENNMNRLKCILTQRVAHRTLANDFDSFAHFSDFNFLSGGMKNISSYREH